jgi:hypothetical protein
MEPIMEIVDVRKGLLDAMYRARRRAAERRANTDRASAAFDVFLERTAVPLVRQVANVLRAEGYFFNVFTPSGSVRLMSERNAEDYVEISLDSTGDTPRVLGHSSRSRGRRSVQAEQVIGSGDPGTVSEGELFSFLMNEIEPFVEK